MLLIYLLEGELKAEWKRKLRRPRRLFQALMKQYYRQLARKRGKKGKQDTEVAAQCGSEQRPVSWALLCPPLPMPPLAYLQQQLIATSKAVFIQLE
jgi:hypothetical protein